AEADEDDREAEDEKGCAGQHPAAPLLLQLDPREPGHVAEIARHERQHAGREERHQTGERAHQQGERQRTGLRDARQRVRGGGEVHRAGYFSARTSSTRPTSVVVSTGASTRAASRPCWSSTSVAGGSGALPLSCNRNVPPFQASEG